jgi:geranylgeranyl diphosphate synthase type II
MGAIMTIPPGSSAFSAPLPEQATPPPAASPSDGAPSGLPWSDSFWTTDYETRFGDTSALINATLDRILDPDAPGQDAPAREAAGLWEAMRYGSLNGGKRIRSVLAIEACKACGGDVRQVLPTACAIELVHAQSLMHDDLPCMDNDDMRRGKPSVHKAFGESTAVLAGDALIAVAFGLIARRTPLGGAVTPERLLAVLGDFADVTSVKGLVNGQFVDIFYEGKPYTPEILEYIHTYKTGALFRFALSSGVRLAGAPEPVAERFARIGQTLGLTFQIVDDLLDIGATSEMLGKTAGKDRLQEKATYPALFGEEASARQAEQLALEALALLAIRDGLPETYDPSALEALVGFVFRRSR